MDAQIFKAAIEYELLAKTIYQSILAKEGLGNNIANHNVSIRGRSGAAHQIDIHWEYCIAGINHSVLVECKNYGTSLTLEKARAPRKIDVLPPIFGQKKPHWRRQGRKKK